MYNKEENFGQELEDELEPVEEVEQSEIVDEEIEDKPVKKDKKKDKKKDEEPPQVYKSYDIRWMKREGQGHPAFGLVAEYEKKYGEIN